MTLGWSYNRLGDIMGFESQLPRDYFSDLIGGVDYTSADAVNFAAGGSAASMKWQSPYDAVFNYVAHNIGGTLGIGSCSFATAYQSGLASGEFCMVHSLGSAFGWGVGFYNSGGAIKIALIDGSGAGVTLGVAWSGNQTLTPGTFYRVQWRTSMRGVSGLTWWGHLRLYDDAGTTLLDDSGLIAMTVLDVGNTTCQYVCFGANTGNLLAGPADLVYNIDDVVPTLNGTWAPQYAKVPASWPDSAEGTYTDWALGVGATEWGAVDERPPNTDEAGGAGDYIQRTATTPGVQSFNATNTGIVLTGAERILGISDIVRVRNQSEDTISQSGSSASAYSTITPPAQLQWNTHVISGSLHRVMIIAVAILNSAVTVTAMTVTSTTGTGAQTPTLLAVSSNGNWRVEFWYLAIPTTGTRRVNVTLSGATDVIGMETVLKGATSVQGVQTANPFGGGSYGSANGNTGTSASVNTPNPPSQWDYHWCLSVVVSSDASLTAGQTQDQNVTGANGSAGMSHRTAINPAAAQAMSWSAITEGSNWAIIAVNILPRAKAATFNTFSLIDAEYSDSSGLAGQFYYRYLRTITAPPLGGWSVADLDGEEIGVQTFSGQSLARRCTQILQEVAYGLEFYDLRDQSMTAELMQPDPILWKQDSRYYLSCVADDRLSSWAAPPTVTAIAPPVGMQVI